MYFINSKEELRDLVLNKTLTNETLHLYNYYSIDDFSFLFANCYDLETIPHLDTSHVVSMFGMFRRCENLKTIPLLNTTNVVDMSSMFEGCSSLESIPHLDTSYVVSMDLMFVGCTSLKTIPQLEVTLLKQSSSMFAYCSNIEYIPFFDTPNLIECNYMFFNCSKLKSIPININNIYKENYINIIKGCENIDLIDKILFLEKDINNDFKKIILQELDLIELTKKLESLY